MRRSRRRSACTDGHRSLEDTVERARHYGAIAKDALEIFPATALRDAMIEVVDFCIARSV